MVTAYGFDIGPSPTVGAFKGFFTELVCTACSNGLKVNAFFLLEKNASEDLLIHKIASIKC
jgi:hypothetical protein